jgi:hypothetical protein
MFKHILLSYNFNDFPFIGDLLIGSVNLYATLEDTINCSPSAKQFISSTREKRTEMHKALIRNIESNEFVEDETPDAAIIQGALLQTR